jgi:two-component system cell cycle sensor histidine kinase/response regulator CckA
MTTGPGWEAVLDATPDAILLFDESRRVVYANAAAKLLFDRIESSLLGARAEDVVDPDDLEAFTSLLDQAFEDSPEAEGPGRVELGIRRARGLVASVEVRFGLVAGAAPLALCSLHDLTFRKAAAERRANLEAAISQSQRMEAIGRLAGGVAHDFNNLLAVVLNYTTFVTEQLPPNSPVHADLDEIRRAGERGAALTRQLLLFGQRDQEAAERVDLNDTIRNLAKLLVRTLGEQVELEVSLGDGLWPVEVAPSRIEQAIVNLALNARDAMPDGGSLTITTDNLEIDEVYADAKLGLQPGRYVCVTVSDDGPGMGHGEVEHIFEPFFSTKSKAEGPGLGLTAVHGIVAAAGGQITVYSEPGMGTAFKIHLPAAGDEAAGAVSKSGPAERKTGTVLVVEDEPAVLEMAVRVLERAGNTVFGAVDGVAALEVLESHAEEIDLVLADVVMPRMSGPELAQRVRDAHPDLPLIFMSGYAEEMIKKGAIARGEVTLVEKPFTGEKLISAVAEAL